MGDGDKAEVAMTPPERMEEDVAMPGWGGATMTMTAVGGGEDGGCHECDRVSPELHDGAGETLPHYGGAVGGNITLTLNPGLNLFGKTLPSTLGIRSLPTEMSRASSHRLVFH